MYLAPQHHMAWWLSGKVAGWDTEDYRFASQPSQGHLLTHNNYNSKGIDKVEDLHAILPFGILSVFWAYGYPTNYTNSVFMWLYVLVHFSQV